MSAKKPPKKTQLSVEQIEIVGQFSDYSFDFPKLDFKSVAKNCLPAGVAGNRTPSFKREAKEVFERERER